MRSKQKPERSYSFQKLWTRTNNRDDVGKNWGDYKKKKKLMMTRKKIFKKQYLGGNSYIYTLDPNPWTFVVVLRPCVNISLYIKSRIFYENNSFPLDNTLLPTKRQIKNFYKTQSNFQEITFLFTFTLITHWKMSYELYRRSR